MGMTILREPQREEVEQSLALLSDVADERAREAANRIRAALREAEQDDFLTTTEAAHALGIRSINTIKVWVKTGYLKGKRIGGRTLIPQSEIERIQNSDQVRGIQTLDRLHDQIADFGADEGMSEEQLEMLHQSRPGVLPWERETAAERLPHPNG